MILDFNLTHNAIRNIKLSNVYKAGRNCIGNNRGAHDADLPEITHIN